MYELTCELCGKKFTARTRQQKVCHWPHEKTCEQCGRVFYLKNNNNKNTRFCSLECASQYKKDHGVSKQAAKKAKATRLKRYGSTELAKTSKLRKCIICGKMFVPTTSNNRQTCYGDHYKPCCVCGKPVKVTSRTYKNNVTCCKECATQKMLNTMSERYGKPGTHGRSFANKKKETSQKRYGVDWGSQSDEVKRKVIRTNLDRYGTSVSSKSRQVKDKAVRTFQQHYGVDNPMKCKEVVEKLKENNVRKYGVPGTFQRPDVKEKSKSTCMKKYGVEWPCLTDNARNGNGKLVSNVNRLFRNILLNSGINSDLEFRLGNRSYDLHIAGTNVLVEVNPTASHNSYINVYSGKVIEHPDVQYHINKSKLAESHGYRCVHVWDWDDWEKVVKLVLPTSKIIYARKCGVVELSKQEADEFLNKNHLQGTCKGQKVRLGLECEGNLVEVMTFGTPRYNRRFEWEILRLCSSSGTSVKGGPSRLFSYFVKKYNPESVLSYCDRSKFTGDVYKNIGMKLADEGSPNKHWYSPRKSERMQHITNNFLLQRGFDQIFGTSFGKGTSNEELMLDRGYLPVYDCGQMRFEWYC